MPWGIEFGRAGVPVLRVIKSALMKLLPQSVLGRLRAWRVRRLIRSFPARVVEHAYGRWRFKVRLSDPLAEGWYDND